MTPKEKAIELVSMFMPYTLSYGNEYSAKYCALIAVEEILKSGIEIDYYYDDTVGYFISYLEYYYEVKKEIEKL